MTSSADVADILDVEVVVVIVFRTRWYRPKILS